MKARTILLTSIEVKSMMDPGFASSPCYLCGRETSERASTRYIGVTGGGGEIFAERETEEDEADRGYMGWHPVGPHCAKAARKAGALVLTRKQLGWED